MNKALLLQDLCEVFSNSQIKKLAQKQDKRRYEEDTIGQILQMMADEIYDDRVSHRTASANAKMRAYNKLMEAEALQRHCKAIQRSPNDLWALFDDFAGGGALGYSPRAVITTNSGRIRTGGNRS